MISVQGQTNPSPTDDGATRPRLSRGAILRFLVLVFLVAGALAAFRWTPLGELLGRDVLLERIGALRAAWWAPLALIGIYTACCTFGLPASPLMLVGGAVFGAGLGGLYNYLGTMTSALVGFAFGRVFGAQIASQVGGAALNRLQRRLNRRAFWSLAGVRLLPIPFPVVNFGMAMAGIRFPIYALASAVGLAPSVFLWTWFAAALFNAQEGSTAGLVSRLVLAMLLLLILLFAPQVVVGRKRRRRLEELRAVRASRP